MRKENRNEKSQNIKKKRKITHNFLLQSNADHHHSSSLSHRTLSSVIHINKYYY